MLPSDNGPVTIDAVIGLLRDGALRRFRIDIEADSTITGDESQEKQDRTAFIQATTEFITAWTPILQANPKMAKMAGDILMFGVRGFRVGRELEESIEATVDSIEDASQQPPPPDPKMQAEQSKLELQKAKSAAEIQKAQIDANSAQIDGQAKVAQTMLAHHTAMRQANMDEQLAQADFQRQQALQAQQAAMLPGGE